MAKRPYEISLWTHTDRFLSVLLTSETPGVGEGYQPQFYSHLSGEQTLTFTIPIKVYLPEENRFIDNEKWYSQQRASQQLANERKVKLIFNKLEQENGNYVHEIHEFIIENIVEQRNEEELLCEITCTGAAFKELGKTGTELLLNLETMLLEEETEEKTFEPTINYWLDRVFASKASTVMGAVPWTYEINMLNNFGLDSNKLYEKNFIVNWEDRGGALVPIYSPTPLEKQRFIEVENSNRYNITQDIAEIFQVFVRYEYRYEDENDPFRITKKVVVFYDNMVKDTEYSITYGNNEIGLSKVSDSVDVTTKMFVNPIESENMDDGFVSIARASSSKTKDNFILDFGYFIESGQLTDSQKQAIPKFERELRQSNILIGNKAEKIAGLDYDIMMLEADISNLENKYNATNENIIDIEDKLLGFDNTQLKYDVVDKGVYNSAQGDGAPVCKFRRQGVRANTVVIAFANGTIIPRADYTLQYDNYGYAVSATFIVGRGIVHGTLLKLTYTYDLLSFYRNERATQLVMRNSVTNTLNQKKAQLTSANNTRTTEAAALKVAQEAKQTLVDTFNLKMAPFLKEGIWNESVYQPAYENRSLTSLPLSYDPYELTGEKTASYMEGITKKYYHRLGLPPSVSASTIDSLIVSHSFTENGLNIVRELHSGAQFTPEFIYNKPVAGEYTTLAQLLNANPSTSSSYYVQADGKVYHNPGTGWVVLNPIVELVFDKETQIGEPGHVFKIGNVVVTADYYRPGTAFTIARRRWWLTHDGRPNSARLENFQAASLVLKQGATTLEEFEDYNIVNNGSIFGVTIKITDRALYTSTGYNAIFKLDVSSEQLYRDALEVSATSAMPEATYEVTFAYLFNHSTPGVPVVDKNFNRALHLGDIVRITDHDLRIRGLKGIVTSIDLNLDLPEDSTITIANYKTKFEDLFQRLVASSEAMRTNGYLYDRAASILNPNMTIAGSIITESFKASDFIIAPGGPNNSTSYGPEGFVTETSYLLPTGVTGITRVTGGNILLSDSLDSDGNRIWGTAISPLGINASVIRAGRIDTERVNIYSGDQLRFAWIAEGLFAYKDSLAGRASNTFVRYNEDGLLFSDEGVRAVELGWDGLYIGSQSGSVELTAQEGLEIYDGNSPRNLLIKLGGFGMPNIQGIYPDYGMKFYRVVDGLHIETLTSTNHGELWLRDSLMVGAHGSSNFVGITGAGVPRADYDPIRIWAGSEQPAIAPFYVTHAGKLRATQADISGRIVAQEGYIGNWIINQADNANGELISANGQVGLSSGGIVLWSGGQAPGPTWQPLINYNSGDLVYWNGQNYVASQSSIGINPSDPVPEGEQPKWSRSPQTVATFFVDSSGKLHATNATISGDVTATKIMAATGEVGGWRILPDRLVSSADKTGMASSGGRYVFWAGGEAEENPLFSITHEGSLFAQSAEILGVIYANRGFINDLFAIGSGAIWTTGVTYYPGDKVFYDGYYYQASEEIIDESPEDSTAWNQIQPYSYLSGDIVNTIYALKIGDYFSVEHDGKMQATDGRFSGEIIANSGQIGGWALVNGGLMSQNEQVMLDAVGELTIVVTKPKIITVPIVEDDVPTGEEEEIEIQEVQFSLTNEGALYSKNASIEGHIEATTGKILGKLSIGAEENYSYIAAPILNPRPDPDENPGENLYVHPLAVKIGDNFSVTHDGLMTVINANVSGTITATEGYIGGLAGWIIKEGLITTASEDVGLHAKSNEYLAGEGQIPVRIWAGTYNTSSPTETPFLVLSDGSLYSTKADIRGAIVAESGYIRNTFRIGDPDNGIAMFVKRDEAGEFDYSYLGSSQFASGSVGFGWSIRDNGYATFDNVQVRGKIKSTVFEHNRISAVGGSLYVAPTIHYLEYSNPVEVELDGLGQPTSKYIVSLPNSFTTTNIGGKTWAVGDNIIYEFSAMIGAELVDFTNMNGEIIAIDGETITLRINANEITNSDWREQLPGTRINPGALIIFYGHASNRQAIYLTALTDEGGPFIDIVDNSLDVVPEEKPEPKVRLGRLNGITDNYFIEKQLKGYGLYSQNAYLRGQFMLPGAGMTNQSGIKYSYLTDAPERPIYNMSEMTPSELNSPIRIWAGLPEFSDNIKQARFIVTESGFLYANAGIFSGVVNATDGEFSGVLKAAGIVIDKPDPYSFPPSPTWDKAFQHPDYNHFYVAYKKNPHSMDDYVLDISSAGISVWEGGLRAYSDWEGGWRNGDVNGPSAEILRPYGYDSITNSDPYPYFALVDDEQSRVSMRAIHIVDIIRENDQNHTYHSIKSERGKFYFDVDTDTVLLNPDYNTIEKKIVNQTTSHFIGVTKADNGSILELGGSSHGVAINTNRTSTLFVGVSIEDIDNEVVPEKTLNVQGTIYVYDKSEGGKGVVSLGGAEVQEAKDTQGNFIGLNIIV